MKLVIAYVQPERLHSVKEALSEVEVSRMSVTNALGCGQQGGFTETYRGADFEVRLQKKVRFEIAVNDNFWSGRGRRSSRARAPGTSATG